MSHPLIRPVVTPNSRVAVAMPYAKNTGFAMTALFSVFREVAARLAGSPDDVIAIYAPSADVALDRNELTFSWATPTASACQSLAAALQERRVSMLLGLDIGVEAPYLPFLRQAGVQTVISYWGAPMSGVYAAPLLALRQLQVRLHRHRPDHFVFESEAMRALAVRGRGVSSIDTSIVPTGIDLQRFCEGKQPGYLQSTFAIPPERATIVYSGHFEARKGVAVLVQAARILREQFGRTDFQLVLAGNRQDEDQLVHRVIEGTPTAEHVTVAGYRQDLPLVFQDAALGCIPSVGWDSFPMSALEMQAAGLPLVASDLQGVPETLWDGVTGKLFRSGDAQHCAEVLAFLLDRPALRAQLGAAAQSWVAAHYTRTHFVSRLTDVCAQTTRRRRAPWTRLGERGSIADFAASGGTTDRQAGRP